MWQSWQTMPALPCGPSFHSSCVDFTQTSQGAFSLWQVPQNSRGAEERVLARLVVRALDAPARFPCFVLPGSEIQL